MSSKPITAVLGLLGLTQVRYVSPVRRPAARGLVGRVYEQVEEEFGVLAPSVALHSPAPEVLAASWLMLREVLLVTSNVDRTAKEAVAAMVSLGNTCPWCVAIHSTTFSRLSGNAAQSITDPRLQAIAAWAKDCGTREGALQHEPACSAQEAPELIGTVALLHYFNRMVNVFLTELPIPPGTPRMALGPVMQVLGRKIQPAAGQSYQPGTSLELLPTAPLSRRPIVGGRQPRGGRRFRPHPWRRRRGWSPLRSASGPGRGHDGAGKLARRAAWPKPRMGGGCHLRPADGAPGGWPSRATHRARFLPGRPFRHR